jgi:hypothetical protein
MSARSVGPRVERDELDGIPVFWCEGGPSLAALMFRVGRADETLPSAGLTHLVEHLALSTMTRPSYDENAYVDDMRTVFHLEGDGADISKHFREVSAGLRELPLSRLELERQVVQNEAESREPGARQALQRVRFGAHTYGLAYFDEYGLLDLDAESVAAWAKDRFTAGNAVLAMTRHPPADLRIALPPGRRIPPVAIEPVRALRLPAATAAPVGGIGIEFLVPRSSAISVALQTLERRAERVLRNERGLSYEVTASYDPLAVNIAEGTVWASSAEERAGLVRAGLLEVIDEFAASGPSEAELRDAIEQMRRSLADPSGAPTWVMQCAEDELMGAPVRQPAELLELRLAVTRTDAAAALATAMESAVLLQPAELELPGGRYNEYPARTSPVVPGREFQPRRGGVDGELWQSRLVVGGTGISFRHGDGTIETVQFAECAAMGWTETGYRILWGNDGFVVEIDRSDWHDGDQAVVLIDEAVPPYRCIALDRTPQRPLSRLPFVRLGPTS